MYRMIEMVDIIVFLNKNICYDYFKLGFDDRAI